MSRPIARRMISTVSALLALYLGLPCSLGQGMNWQLLQDGEALGSSHELAYDSSRDVPLLFETIFPDELVREFDGSVWRQRFLIETPSPARDAAALAFDAVRHVTVLFGGTSPSVSPYFFNDTWEYDGTSWTHKFPAHKPDIREYASMTFDSRRGKIVLFGGRWIPQIQPTRYYNDTWEYDGVDWTLVQTTGPPARCAGGMTYDSGRGVVVLAFGQDNDSQIADTWEYNGRRWTQRTPAVMPSARLASLAYSPALGKTITFGGAPDGTWAWNGSNWTQLSPLHSPPIRNGGELVYDSQRGKVLLYGGTTWPGSSACFVDTWLFDGDWQQAPSPIIPTRRGSYGLSWDPTTKAVLLHGGGTDCNSTTMLQDTWQFSGAGWSMVNVGTPPAVGGDQEMVYDEIMGRHLRFGDSNPPQTWFFDSSTTQWSQAFPPDSPSARVDSALAYDAAQGRVVLYGGQWGTHYADTWMYNEAYGWVQFYSSSPPGRRTASAMVFDTLGQRVLLYGGVGNPGDPYPTDTWQLKDFVWSLVPTNHSPGVRKYASMAFDSARGRAVLFGSPLTQGDRTTWEFDGSDWFPVVTQVSPTPDRVTHRMIFDPVHQAIIMFGSGPIGLDSRMNDTWAYGPDPDQDGFVGLFDNCPSVANSTQVDADGDGHGDLCDCAPGNAGVFAVPTEVAGLAVSGSSATTISWTDLGAEAGAATHYDLVTGSLVALRQSGNFAGASCLANDLPSPSYPDTRAGPTAGDGYYYLARGQNSCGNGTYGNSSLTPDPRDLLDASSPCP